MIKKLISFFTSFILITGILFNVNAFANENKGITYEEFKKAQDDGYIGKEITYEKWNEIIALNNQLEYALEKDGNFKKIYDSSEETEIYGIYEKKLPKLQKGDVLVTNGTSSFGLTGHTGIAIGEDSILHIRGVDELVEVQDRDGFFHDYVKDFYKWIKVYRPDNSRFGEMASDWAEKTYKNSNSKYKITTDINSTNETYCSKIVFQAYKFGANIGAFSIWGQNVYNQNELVVLPYKIKDLLKVYFLDDAYVEIK